MSVLHELTCDSGFFFIRFQIVILFISLLIVESTFGIQIKRRNDGSLRTLEVDLKA